jgi:starvation-inducible outer membrane lipoprotein
MYSIDQLKTKIESLQRAVKSRDKKINLLEIALKENEPIDNEERNYLYSQIDHLQRHIIEQSANLTMYQQWFARNAHWTQRFNNMMKYNPNLGNYDQEGADEEIIIPEPIVWEIVKISTVADTSDEE